jgi:predicted porin
MIMRSEAIAGRGAVVAIAALTLSLAPIAHVEAAPAPPSPADAAPAAPTPKPAGASQSPLTFAGVTLYGTVDVGVAYLNHGAPLSADYGAALPFLVQKFSNRSITSIAPNGLGQSKIGLSGVEPLSADASLVFKLETGFQPTSGHLADGPKSLIKDNGLPLASQTTSGDSSRAGQPLEGAAWVGLNSKTFGAVTFGRQNALLLDNVAKYDPQAAAQAFSPLGYTGFTSGAGVTEGARLDQSLKYAYAQGPLRLAYLHQFGKPGSIPGGADQVDAGFDYRGFSADATYTNLHDAISEASLTAAQAAANPGTLAATVSDNLSYALEGRYVWRRLKLYAGWESITFANPTRAVPVGAVGIGGYRISVVNNTAYAIHRVQQVTWTGVRYSVTPAFDISAGYYRYDQNSFKGNGCADASASSCRGQMQDYSLLADYRLSKRFDIYAGVNASNVAHGLAAGYLVTSSAGPMAGARFSF